jgi:hypothetical protein
MHHAATAFLCLTCGNIPVIPKVLNNQRSAGGKPDAKNPFDSVLAACLSAVHCLWAEEYHRHERERKHRFERWRREQ